MVDIRGHHLRDNSSRLSPQTWIDVYIGIQNEKGGGTRSAGSELLGGNSRDGEGHDGFAGESRGERRGGWQSVLRPVDAATMPAAAAAAASTTSTEQHRIRVIRRDSGCCGVANSVEGEQPGRVRPAWWGLTRSRSVSVPRSRGDVISGGSRAVFFLSRSLFLTCSRHVFTFVLSLSNTAARFSLRTFPLSISFLCDNCKKFLFLSLLFFVFFILSPYVSTLIFCLMVSCSRTK